MVKIGKKLKKKDWVIMIGYQLFHNNIKQYSALGNRTPKENVEL